MVGKVRSPLGDARERHSRTMRNTWAQATPKGSKRHEQIRVPLQGRLAGTDTRDRRCVDELIRRARGEHRRQWQPLGPGQGSDCQRVNRLAAGSTIDSWLHDRQCRQHRRSREAVGQLSDHHQRRHLRSHLHVAAPDPNYTTQRNQLAVLTFPPSS